MADGVLELVLARSVSAKAAGGKLKAGATLTAVLSLPRMSLEEPGVGGGLGRGILAALTKLTYAMAVVGCVLCRRYLAAMADVEGARSVAASTTLGGVAVE